MKKESIMQYIKMTRKLSREEEFEMFNKSINHGKVFKNKKKYNRKKNNDIKDF